VKTITTYFLIGMLGFEVDVTTLKAEVIEKVGINYIIKSPSTMMMDDALSVRASTSTVKRFKRDKEGSMHMGDNGPRSSLKHSKLLAP
jgi:hypothetical protein